MQQDSGKQHHLHDDQRDLAGLHEARAGANFRYAAINLLYRSCFSYLIFGVRSFTFQIRLSPHPQPDLSSAQNHQLLACSSCKPQLLYRPPLYPWKTSSRTRSTQPAGSKVECKYIPEHTLLSWKPGLQDCFLPWLHLGGNDIRKS